MYPSDRIVLARNVIKLNDEVIKSLPAKVERKIQASIYRLGQEIRDKARSLCPKKTGALAASIYVTRGVQNTGANKSTAPFSQSTHGYFRAINAARKKNNRIDVMDAGQGVNPITQRPSTSAGMQSVMTKINGVMYRAYTTGEHSVIRNIIPSLDIGGKDRVENTIHDEFVTPTITEIGGAGRNTFFVTVGAAAFYAGFVEFGHHTAGKDVPPHPFLGPAIEWGKDRAVALVRAEMASMR